MNVKTTPVEFISGGFLVGGKVDWHFRV